MLSVAPDAPAEEIKKAFRREIARYHPDKVQHLGPEFQDMAAGIAADLTEAYRVLMDPAMRAKYNGDLFGGSDSEGAPRPSHAPAYEQPAPPPPAESPTPSPSSSSSSSSSSASSSARPGPPPTSRPSSPAGAEFIRRASLSRLKDAIEEVMGDVEPSPVTGFDLAVTSKPRRGPVHKADGQIRLLI